MNQVKKFEDLQVWKDAMDLCTVIYKATNSSSFSKEFVLKEQIRKSVVSIPSNIAEGFERDSHKQFIYFLIIAKGSCGELRTQLKIAQLLEYIAQEQYNILNNNCLLVSKQLSGFINYLKHYKPS